MDPAVAWRSLFEGWPDAIPREGMIVTLLNETIPFTGFMSLAVCCSSNGTSQTSTGHEKSSCPMARSPQSASRRLSNCSALPPWVSSRQCSDSSTSNWHATRSESRQDFRSRPDAACRNSRRVSRRTLACG